MRPQELRRAIELREEMEAQLGGRCEHCGRKYSFHNGKKCALEFNHKQERTWKANRFNMYQRMLKIRKELALNLINLLCRSCNGSFRPAPLITQENEHPF